MNYKAKLGTAMATAALMAGAFAPMAAADTDITIKDNGNNSTNNVTVDNNSTTSVNQTNSFTVSLDLSAKANTGGNQANGNNGGDVTIDTGNATAAINVTVNGGGNMAEIPCACDATNDVVLVKDNGNNSENKTNVKNKKNKTVSQVNAGGVNGSTKVKAKTGKNKANNNNQSGLTEVTTGNSNSTVDVMVTQPTNEVVLMP